MRGARAARRVRGRRPRASAPARSSGSPGWSAPGGRRSWRPIYGARQPAAGRVCVDGRRAAARRASRAAVRRRASGWRPRSARARRCCCCETVTAQRLASPSLPRFSRGGLARPPARARRRARARSRRSTSARPTRDAPGAHAVRRQPAEGRAGPLAAARLPAAAPRRADPRRGRRRPRRAVRRDPPSSPTRGVGVLLVSSEVPEVLGLADRVLVVREGASCTPAPARELDERRRARPGHGRERRRAERARSPTPAGIAAAAAEEQRRGERRRPPTERRGRGVTVAGAAPRRGPPPRAGRRAGCSLVVVGAITQPEQFLDRRQRRRRSSAQASTIGVITVGMTFVIIGGGIDLSVGAMMALASVWATTVATQAYGLGGDGAVRDPRRDRLRPRHRAADRLRAARAVHRHPRDAGRRARDWRSDRRTARPSSSRARERRLVSLSTTHVLGLPLARVHLRRRRGGRLAAAQPHHVRPPHVRRRRQPRGGAARRHRRPPAHRSCCTRCPGSAAASPRSSSWRGPPPAPAPTATSTNSTRSPRSSSAARCSPAAAAPSSARSSACWSSPLITNLFILNNLQTGDQQIAKGAIIVGRRAAPARGHRSPAPDPARPSPPPASRRSTPCVTEPPSAGSPSQPQALLLGAAAAGAGAASPRPAPATSRGRRPGGGPGRHGRRRQRQARQAGHHRVLRARRPTTAGSTAIAKNAKDAGQEVLRRDVEAGRGDQRHRPADRRRSRR